MPDKNFTTSIQLILQASAAGQPHHEAVLTIGKTPQYLLDNGFPDLPLQIKAKTIDKAHFDHGITLGVLKRLGDIIDSPQAVFRSATQQGAAVVVTFELKQGNPIMVPVHGNKRIGRVFANEVASIYAKEDPTVVQRWLQQGLQLHHK